MKSVYIYAGALALLFFAGKKALTIQQIDASNMKENIQKLNSYLLNWGITSRAARIGILCVIGKESGFVPKFEKGYSGTSNDRIRAIFPTKTKGLTDADIDYLKASSERFFNHVYGGILGNDKAGDGFRYRGSGFNQLTGKANYQKFKELSGHDIVNNPALNNTLEVAFNTMMHFFQQGWQSSEGRKKLAAKGYKKVNDISDVNWAIRFFANINAGVGNSMNSTKVSNAFKNAYAYFDTVNLII